jgi:hypothetical protein
MSVQAKCTVAFHHSSGLPEDDAINTFHFQCAGLTPPIGSADVATIVNFLSAALTTTHGGGTAKFVDMLSELMSGQFHIKLYDLADTAPRQPKTNLLGTYTPGTTGDPLPQEVALCMSYQATAASGFPQRRRRGRIYAGPLQTNAGAAGTIAGADGRPTALAINTLKQLGTYLIGNPPPLTSGSAVWGVRSQMDDVTRPVTTGWVDNEWDTQRRRGRRATTRNIY